MTKTKIRFEVLAELDDNKGDTFSEACDTMKKRIESVPGVTEVKILVAVGGFTD